MSNDNTEPDTAGAPLAPAPDASAMLVLGSRAEHDALIKRSGHSATDSRTTGWFEQLHITGDGSYPLSAPIPAVLVNDVEQIVETWATEVDADGEGLHTAVHRAFILAWPAELATS